MYIEATKLEAPGPMMEIRSTKFTLRSLKADPTTTEPVNDKIDLREFTAHLAQLLASYMPPNEGKSQ